MKGRSIEGFWIILVQEDGQKVPLLARAGHGLYLLAFRSGQMARKFVQEKAVAGAETRMVVSANSAEILTLVQQRGVTSVLIDYDSATNTYREAELIF
ncbi:MAG: hypothetical protein HY698_17320 [Deltaproteobacteria bacterium]|nr:hypothetical protein [Deltaproteobacteria bacterium]